MRNKLLASLLIGLPLALSSQAQASSNINQLGKLSQSEFNLFARDLLSAASYKAIAPAEALGITGFDIGAELTVTQLGSEALWKKAGADVSQLAMPKLHIHKGLPFNIDVGAMITRVPNTNIQLMGAEIRYAFIEGGVTTPAIAIRAAATKLSGVDQLDFSSQSLELTASKGIAMFTPYVGVGKVWGTSTPNVLNLKKVTDSQNKLFAGLNANFGLMNIAGEVDKTGDNQSVSVKLGWRF
jgi:hypothetical protein